MLGMLATAQNKITLHADKIRDTISKNFYGHLAEHLGHASMEVFMSVIT
jgi:alpha-L-arabinofuranosidase